MNQAQSKLETLYHAYKSHKGTCSQCAKQVKGQTSTLQYLCVKGIEMFREISRLSK